MKKVTLSMMLGLLLAGGAMADVQVGNVSSKYDITVYGYVKLDAIYDSHKTAVGDLAFYTLPETAEGKDSETRLHARQTRLGLKVKGPEVEGGKVSANVEMDFFGKADSDNAYHPRMRLGYLDWAFSDWSLRAGQDWETFITAVPNTINFATMSDHGALGLRRPQFRVTKDIPVGDYKIVTKAAVARTIGEDIDGGGQNDGVDSDIPTFQYNVALRGKMLTEKETALGISGHWGREVCDFTNAVAGIDEEKFDSWSVIGSLILPVINELSLVGTIWTGENLDTYYGGIGQGINTKEKDGIRANGGFIQAQIFPMDKVNVNLALGLDEPESGDVSKGMRSKNETMIASVFYKFTADLSVGLEYQYLKTSYKDADSVDCNRVQGAMQFNF